MTIGVWRTGVQIAALRWHRAGFWSTYWTTEQMCSTFIHEHGHVFR